MFVFKNFADIHTYLDDLVSRDDPRHKAYMLDRMKVLMDYLGNPQDRYNVIHVAGTSGKTSTCYYLTALLGEGNNKVGLTVSPHVSEVNERVQIDGQPLEEATFCKEFGLFMRAIEQSKVSPTYFELFVAFAFWEFARQKVDNAVVEVGVGGLLDGTNVMTRSDKVCVITDIGYDHTRLLGDTLPDIAAQKAGIILPRNAVFCFRQGEEVMQTIREVSREKAADLHEIIPTPVGPGHLPSFQRRNWQLARTVYEYLAKRDALTTLDAARLNHAAHTRVPARMETVYFSSKTLVLDGAHNPQKLDALAKSLREIYPHQAIAGMVAFARTKSNKIHDNLEAFLSVTSHLVITSFLNEQTGNHSTEPQLIGEQCDVLGYKNYEIKPGAAAALEHLLERPEPVLLITGSFYLLQRIRPLIIKDDDTSYRRH